MTKKLRRMIRELEVRLTIQARRIDQLVQRDELRVWSKRMAGAGFGAALLRCRTPKTGQAGPGQHGAARPITPTAPEARLYASRNWK